MKKISTSRKREKIKGITKLGSKKTVYQLDNPSKSILETFDNKHPNNLYLVTFTQPRDEFASLCVSGSTKIDIAIDETKHPIGVPIKNLVGTSGVVFGFDLDTKLPVARKYHSVRKTQEQAKVVTVVLERISSDGQGNKVKKIHKKITVTPDHLVLVSTGWHKFSWVEAQNLKEGMRLVADQRSQDTIRGKLRHRLVGECLLGRFLDSEEHMHHEDQNHFNNCPENLICKLNSDHCRDHRVEQYKYFDKLPSIDVLVEMYNSGQENFSSLAKKFSCDQSTIFSRIGHLVEKRTQRESLLAKPESIMLHEMMLECRNYYEEGYTTTELAEFYDLHPTTISQWIVKSGGKIRTSLQTKEARKNISLASLNHKVIRVEDGGIQDVYNMEVDDVENFFGDGVVLHNCPITNQPDQAKIEILYVPNEKMVESKSLKLYLFAFRNQGSFHEDIINTIFNHLWTVLSPKYLRVFGDFSPRGGIAIKPLIEKVDEIDLFEESRLFRLVDSWDRRVGKE